MKATGIWSTSRQKAVSNRKRVQRLMRLVGIAAVGPKPRTSKPGPGHRIFPYLLRSMTIDRPNQVWAADFTYSAPRPEFRGAYSGMHRERRKEGMPCAFCEGA
jgi:putative transposase